MFNFVRLSKGCRTGSRLDYKLHPSVSRCATLISATHARSLSLVGPKSPKSMIIGSFNQRTLQISRLNPIKKCIRTSGSEASTKFLSQSEEEKSRLDGSYHWIFERVLSVALLPLIIIPVFTGPSQTIDFILGVLLPLHCHLGYSSIVIDYLPYRRVKFMNKLSIAFTYLLTILAIYGCYEFNTNDVGITTLVSKVWCSI